MAASTQPSSWVERFANLAPPNELLDRADGRLCLVVCEDLYVDQSKPAMIVQCTAAIKAWEP